MSEPQYLSGTAAATPWDPRLAAAMTEHGVRVEEESILDALLSDLRTAAH
ncbi:DUF2399 domain-containing protein [Streptomyces sp. NPDC005921]